MATLKPTVSAVTIDQVSKDCRLRQSRKVVAALRRFWDLMVLESETAGGPDGVVTREGESPPLSPRLGRRFRAHLTPAACAVRCASCAPSARG